MALDADDLTDELYAALGIAEFAGGKSADIKANIKKMAETIVEHIKNNAEVAVSGTSTIEIGDITSAGSPIKNTNQVVLTFNQSGTGSIS